MATDGPGQWVGFTTTIAVESHASHEGAFLTSLYDSRGSINILWDRAAYGRVNEDGVCSTSNGLVSGNDGNETRTTGSFEHRPSSSSLRAKSVMMDGIAGPGRCWARLN